MFVETIGGDLTIKVENNTETGLGIYREEVLDKTQSLDDAQVEFARLGNLVLLKVLPYRESSGATWCTTASPARWRRIDAIGQACVQLPEDHLGSSSPAATTCRSGEYKTFEQSMAGMRFQARRALAQRRGRAVHLLPPGKAARYC